MDRLNKAGTSRRITERPAEFSHHGRQHRLADGRVGPYRLQKFILCNQLVRLAHQALKHDKRLMSQTDALLPIPQPLIECVETERIEHEITSLSHTSWPFAFVRDSRISQNFLRTASGLPRNGGAK